MILEKIEIKFLCKGPCGKSGKTLYQTEVTDPETGKKEELMVCAECAELLRAEQEIIDNKKIELEQIKINKSLSNVPKIFRGMTMENFIDDPLMLHRYFNSDEMKRIAGIKEIMQKFLDAVKSGEGVIIALLGDYGTGKSLIASICANNIVSNGGMARFEHTSMLLKKLMNNNTFVEIINSLMANDLVVLDEVNSASTTEFTERTLSNIINAIYSAQKSLIITANGTGSELKKYIGVKGYDRIQESPNGGIVRCKWPSFRGTDIQSK